MELAELDMPLKDKYPTQVYNCFEDKDFVIIYKECWKFLIQLNLSHKCKAVGSDS